MGRERIEMLLAQFDSTLGQEWWFAPYQKALFAVTSAQAAWSPEPSVNTIWQLVNHVAFWKQLFANRLQGSPLTGGRIQNETTFGPLGDSGDAAGWQASLDRLFVACHAIREGLYLLNDTDLDQPLPGEQTPVGEILAGMALHDGYHIGQIVLLRKLQGSWGVVGDGSE